MWPASMIVGLPCPFTSAMLLPATSPLTFANWRAWSRQTLAGADSKPEGPGVSSSFFRNVIDSGENIAPNILPHENICPDKYSRASLCSVPAAGVGTIERRISAHQRHQL